MHLLQKKLALCCRAPNHSSLTPNSVGQELKFRRSSSPDFGSQSYTAYLLHSISREKNRPSYVVSRALSIPSFPHSQVDPPVATTKVADCPRCPDVLSVLRTAGTVGMIPGYSRCLARYETPQVLCGNTCGSGSRQWSGVHLDPHWNTPI